MKRFLRISAICLVLLTLVCVFTACAEDEVVTPTYTVTFKGEDGTVLKTETVAEYAAATAPEAPAKDNYTFAGWDVKFDNVTEDITVTATYTENAKYTVVFADWDGEELKRETVYTGKGATAPADPTRENYTFAGWDVAFDNITAAKTVTATYTENAKYTVTFKNWDGEELKSEQVYVGNAATAPADPTRENYTFTGWDVAFDNITAETVVTAQFAENRKYTVSFKDHDGEELKSEQVYVGNAATAPADPEREGYKFTGWDVAFDNITAETTVTAQYVKMHTVTFKDHDGTQIGDVQIVEDGEGATAPADPEREGYKFTGWDVAFDNITAETTVTAQYVKLHTVTFKDHDGTQIGDVQIVEDGKGATAPADPERDHFDFTGWDVEYDNITADTVVTATYQEHEKFEVKFVDHDDTQIGDIQTLYAGEEATAPADPTRLHYTFAGWNLTEGSGEITNVTGNMTLKATYTANTKYNIMQWSLGDGMEKLSGWETLAANAIKTANPDILIVNGLKVAQFSKLDSLLTDYTRVSFEDATFMKYSGTAHHVVFKTALFESNGDPVKFGDYKTATQTVGYGFFPLKIKNDGRTLMIASVYTGANIYGTTQGAFDFSTLQKNLNNQLATCDFGIVALHASTLIDGKNDTMESYLEKFGFSNGNVLNISYNNGVNAINDTDVSASQGGEGPTDTNRKQYNFLAVYSNDGKSIVLGDDTKVAADTDKVKDTTIEEYKEGIYIPTKINYGAKHYNCFYCKAFVTTISISPAPAAE